MSEAEHARKLRIAKPRYQDANPFVVAFFHTGEYPRDPVTSQRGEMWECFRLCHPYSPHAHVHAAMRQVWLELRDELLAAWIAERPGTRPYAWWLFDEPRWRPEDRPERYRDLGAWAAQWLAEPRRRVGGIGTPSTKC